MKNVFKLFGIIVLVAIIGFSMVTCGKDSDDNNNNNNNNENEAEANKTRLFNYLADEYGKKIISGQMVSYERNIDMITRVYTDTGKYPALKGFDFIFLPYDWNNYGKDPIDEAIEWWEGKNKNVKLLSGKPDIHGIVTFCWHWRVGSEVEFYTDKTTFRIPWKNGKLDTDSAAFQTLKSDMDKVAALLQLLKDKSIPVLWRPLHEASGGWFWWGASGAEPYKALYEYMYDYFTNTKKLNNLIWVWNGQSQNWFPNPATVDIVGYDVYHNDNPKDYSSQVSTFYETLKMVPAKNRIVALSENGAIPDPDECIKDKAMWSWFMTWNDNKDQGITDIDNFWSGEFHNTKSHKTKVYNHSAVITLDKLPDLTKYRLEGGHDINILTPPNIMPVFTLANNGEWGWQYKYQSDSLFNGAKITNGDKYTFSYSFTSNVNMDKLTISFVDDFNGGWNVISGYIDVKTSITANTVISGTTTITATGTATNATPVANTMVFEAGTGTTSAPTLTFTAFSLVKN